MIEKTTLKKTSHIIALKQCFERVFTEKWNTQTPFMTDVVYLQTDEKRVIGFAMVHEVPPYKFGKGPYVYNLGVDPEYRGKGVGRALLAAIAADHSEYCLHVNLDSKFHKYFMKLGFKLLGQHRLWAEYQNGRPSIAVQQVEPAPLAANDHYDARENIVYLS